MDRTIVKYLKNKAIIFIESDSMLQKKKKGKKEKKTGRGREKKKIAMRAFPVRTKLTGKVTGIFPV